MSGLPRGRRLQRAACALGLAAAVVAAPAAAAPPTAADCEQPAHLRELHPAPPRPAGLDRAEAVWLSERLLRWPGPEAGAEPGRPPGSGYRLLHAARATIALAVGEPARGADAAIGLVPADAPLPPALAARFGHVAAGPTLALADADVAHLPALLRGQLVLVQEDAAGRVLRATAVQHPGALDALYAGAAEVPLGAVVAPAGARFALWAPTAAAVALCLWRGGAPQVLPLARDAATGVWHGEAAGATSGTAYVYLVDVVSPPLGLVRQRVTDPYSLALTADSRRSVLVDLDDPRTQPPGWRSAPPPPRVAGATDLSIYELHVRDFSIGDTSVPRAHRGTYLAFTHPRSRGMRHLRRLAAAGLTDVHLLPVFDLASVPEVGCASLPPAALRGGPASESQQAAVAAIAGRDCFNWGYDPLHFSVPEGSYATDARAPFARIAGFRAMVLALHRAGLRVGMDVVYNHTSAAGNDAKSVLDRIVPGYYHRLDAAGRIERSTCCDNTATEHLMMARLMIDSAVVWVRHYRIDGFRFDLMGHQPRAVMERLQRAVNAAAGRHVHLIGEGWNFGEVKDGARFVQASQLALAGSGIATFSDRARDAVRGGGCCDSGPEVVARQGWSNGLAVDPNGSQGAARATRAELLRAADLVRVGLAGTLAGYRMRTADGDTKTLAEIDYAGQPAGYAREPGEVVNYVENHDNQTLFDLNALKLPRATSRGDRARAQVVALATTAFSQGIAYWHAGVEMLRSKSGDRNSYDSGDWFNRLDWTFTDNGFGAGLPPRRENEALWPLLAPVLADPRIKPGKREIRFTRDAFVDLLRIRASSRLFRLASAEEVQRRLGFHDTGPAQTGSTVVAHLDGRGLADAGFAEVLYAINADKRAARITIPALAGRAFVLHPVHRAASAADARPRRQSRWEPADGTLTVPPRTALVYVLPLSAPRPPSRRP